MKIAGEHTFAVSREQLWQALLDPDVLQNTLPGCEALEQTGENEYRGKLKMKVGPVQGLFEGKVQITDLDPPNGYRLDIDGKGAPGFVKGKGTIRLEPAEAGTVLHYEIDAQVGGRIAAVGQRLLDSSAKVITRQGLEGLERQLPTSEPAAPEVEVGATAADVPPPGATERPASSTPSQAEFVRDFARGMVDELVPRKMRPVLAVGALLVVLAVVAILMRACGG